MSVLNSFVIQNALTTFGYELGNLCQEQVYDTDLCAIHLHTVLEKWLLIIAANNSCGLATPSQLTCFYNALQSC